MSEPITYVGIDQRTTAPGVFAVDPEDAPRRP